LWPFPLIVVALAQPDASWKLSPGVYRSTFPVTDENERLNIERHLAQDFRVESAGLPGVTSDNGELYFLQQHYGMPTRLLDWMHSPLTALHFAVTEDKYKDEDGAFFMMDAYQLAPCQGATDHFEGVMTSQTKISQKALRPIFNWWKPENCFPAFVLPVRPNHFERRVILQKGCFTFHPPGRGTLTTTRNSSLRSFLVPRLSKPDIRDELFLLRIDAFSIYGDLEGLSRRLKFAYKLP
jgi:FRG domain